MKRIIMLLGICFCISGVYAQKFEATPLDEQGDVYEVKIRQFNKLFGKWFTAERVAEPTDGDVAQRSAWRDSCAVKLLTPELKEILKEAADKGGGSCLGSLLLRFGREGTDGDIHDDIIRVRAFSRAKYCRSFIGEAMEIDYESGATIHVRRGARLRD